MVGIQQKITLIKRDWSPVLAAGLLRAMWPNAKEISSEIITGDCVLFEVVNHGLLVIRLEQDNGRKTLVVVAAQGINAGPVMDAYVQIAKAYQADAVRTHTARKGVGRWLEKRGFSVDGKDKGGFVIYGRIVEK